VHLNFTEVVQVSCRCFFVQVSGLCFRGMSIVTVSVQFSFVIVTHCDVVCSRHWSPVFERIRMDDGWYLFVVNINLVIIDIVYLE